MYIEVLFPAMNGVLQTNSGFQIVIDKTRIFDAVKVSADVCHDVIFAVGVLPSEPLLPIWPPRLVFDRDHWRPMAAEAGTHQCRYQKYIESMQSHTCLDTGGPTMEPKIRI